MSNAKHTVHWNQFEAHAAHTFKQLWYEQDLTDVTLATMDDWQIRAHKVILSSSSTFFRNIFMKNPHDNSPVHLKDISYKDLGMIIEFIYTGKYQMEQGE